MFYLRLILGIVVFASSSSLWASVAHGKYFDRMMIVIFENTNAQDASRQPFFAKLASEGANFTALAAEAHPSQGNYVALTSGSLAGVRDDRNIDLDVSNVADLLDAKGLTWKVYAEGYPGGCFTGRSSGRYYRKHNPFISFLNIQTNAQRCAHIVNADQFEVDRAAGRLPEYMFYVPDSFNDGHDTGVAYADRWYQKRFGALFADSNFMDGTLIISTFDENAGRFGNLIYTSLFGPMVRQGNVTQALNHYSLLRLTEDNWSLGTLGKSDVNAPLVPESIWK